MNTPGQPASPPPQIPRNDGLAVVSLVCGIASIVLCLGPLTGIVAVVCGHMARGRIARSSDTLAGAGMALAGLILGYFSFVWALVLFVFLTLMFPLVGRVKGNAQRMEAKNMDMQLVTALKQYHIEYGKFPLASTKLDTDSEPDNGAVLDVLRAVNTSDNPRRVAFFVARAESFRGSALVDPWGHPYRIMLDTNLDNQLNVGSEVVQQNVVVWSLGKNGRDESGMGDDIPSWK